MECPDKDSGVTMSSTADNPTDDNRGDVEQRIEDALKNRYTRLVTANPSKRIAAVLLGRQYAPSTAAEIAQEEVEPIVPDGWFVDGIRAPKADVSVDPPIQACGLRLLPLNGQSIHGKIDILRHTVSLVTGGLNEYLRKYPVSSYDIPGTYGRWDDEFPTNEFDGEVVFEGPIGEARDVDEALQFCFKSSYVRAGVRIINGGGRYQADEFTFHEAVPLAVLEHPTASIALAPVERHLSPNDVGNPDFTYTGSGDEFRILE
ncbi:hypothetical protein ACLI4R_17575 [Natrialbaceae archaeon A-chndr2]